MERSPERSLLVTGLGAVSPIGIGTTAYCRALRTGESGVSLVGFRAPEDLPYMRSTVAAACSGFDARTVADAADLERLPRLVPMALAAAMEACRQARIPVDGSLDPEAARRIGLVLGTGAGGIDFTLDQAGTVYGSRRRPSLWTITNATHGNLAGELSIRLGLRGPSLCVSTGCCSSSDAMGVAMDMLRSDRPGAPETVVVVGADAHVRWETLAGMELLRVISTRDWRSDPSNAPTASRPFDRTRDGFVLGEGAWALVLDRERAARRREAEAEAIATAIGYGCTCDAYHRVRPDPDPVEAARAMRMAIEDARLDPAQIDTIQYHGTATPMNDSLETEAVKLAFGGHAGRLRGSSIKSMIGHPQGACGLASVVAMVAAMTGLDGGGPFIPPTINLHEPDPACDLEYTASRAAPTGGSTVLVNCLAFGAKNSALVLSVAGSAGRRP